ncbi:MAG: cupin-like domain-containing protein [Bacteroidota bacterium]
MKVTNINIVNQISKKDFNENYLYPQKPLVIKGLADKHPAGKKWTIDYIKSVCGDVMVDVFDNNNKNSATAFTDPDLKMKFSEYVDTIVENKPTSLRMFLFNMFKCKPELRKDFPCPDLFKGILGRVGFMFFGARGIKVRIHQDMDFSNVILTQFYGRKRVVLVAPKYSDLLYKLPFNTHSLVDLDNPDYEKYPGLRYIEAYECILEHGDSVYMPSGYWHFITYLDGGFSVSYRKMARSLKAKIQGLLSLCIYMPYDKLMNSLLGELWLVRKEHLAEIKANKAIRKIRQGYDKQMDVRLQHQ